jgi:vitamin B12 transporter
MNPVRVRNNNNSMALLFPAGNHLIYYLRLRHQSRNLLACKSRDIQEFRRILRSRRSVLCLCLSLLMPVMTSFASEENSSETDEELDEIVVRASRVANTHPAGTYESLPTLLRFDPQTELQSRGLPEGQSDVTVRGGVFENTGFVIGAVAVIDPQTGHYTSGLPVDPAFLTAPVLLIGTDNALAGFNSNIATLAYSLKAVDNSGDVVLGAGNHDLWFTSLRSSSLKTLKSGNDLGVAVSAALSQGDGTIDNGDHDFKRYNLRLQHISANTQTDLLVSYQDIFYAWPGAYTGFASLAETDHTKTRLILANHRLETGKGWFEVGAYYRKLEDNYDFDRTTEESGGPGAFEHTTRVGAVGFQGSYRNEKIDWRYGGQLTGDKLLRSTDLTYGDFTSRNYLKLSLVPTIDISLSGNRMVRARIGASLDSSNRDSNAVSPVAAVRLKTTTAGGDNFYELEYVSTSQLPGYTALNSRPAGLFGGNPDLGREKAKQLSLSYRRESLSWSGSASLFYRDDSDLVDWTYSTDTPFSRQANPVDLDVLGLELLVNRQWNSLGLFAGYTYLDKDENYGMAVVDASFYALNYARHRATLAIQYFITQRLELRMDNEYRVQKDNPLRTTRDTAYLVSLALVFRPENIDGLGLTLGADNLTDSDYQFFPGTPAVGRQLSFSAAYRW